MQTKCPRCSTAIRSDGTNWEVIGGPCLDLAGTHWMNNAEFCPTLSKIAEPDVLLPGVTEGLKIEDAIEVVRLKIISDTEAHR